LRDAELSEAFAAITGMSRRMDAISVLEEAMQFFMDCTAAERERVKGKKEKSIDFAVLRQHYRDAADIAKMLAPYRRPRLSAMKINDPSWAPETRADKPEELVPGIMRDLDELGYLPPGTADFVIKKLANGMIDVTPEGEPPAAPQEEHCSLAPTG